MMKRTVTALVLNQSSVNQVQEGQKDLLIRGSVYKALDIRAEFHQQSTSQIRTLIAHCQLKEASSQHIGLRKNHFSQQKCY